MNRRTLRHVVGRLTSAVLALAVLLGPSVAQVDAAEQCRTRCGPAELAGHAACCGEALGSTSADAEVAGHEDGQSPAGKSDPATKYCAGFGARALAVDTPRLTRTLDLAPVL